METKFTINREKVSDEEIESHKDFEKLVQEFKKQSLQKATKEKRWPKVRKLVYTAIIGGILVVCTVTFNEVLKNNTKKTATLHNKELKVIEDKSTKNFIQPISNKTTIPYSKYKVSANKGGTIQHPTTSKIKVPQNAFVKKNGTEVKGEVEIHYREMHDVADFMVSGIPMVYDTLGKQNHFESAGMIDIQGYHDGEQVYIKPGKKLEVDMASKKSGEHFNLYRLDTIQKKWLCIGKDKVIEKATEVEAMHKIEHKDILNHPVYKSYELKKDSVGKVMEVKIASLPKPIAPGKPVAANENRKHFKLDVDPKYFPELAAFKGCVFEVGEENTHYTKEFTTIEWSSAVISEGTQKGFNYTLNLKKGDRKEKLIVYPVLQGKSLEEANKIYQNKFKDYELAQVKKEKDEERIKTEYAAQLKKLNDEQALFIAKLKDEKMKLALLKQNFSDTSSSDTKNALTEFKVRRLFQLASFGVFNSDCARPLDNGTTVDARFLYKDAELKPGLVYLVNLDKNVMFTLNGNNLSKLNFNPSQNYVIITSINNELYLCDKENFKNSKPNQDKTDFQFQDISINGLDVEELKKKLNA